MVQPPANTERRRSKMTLRVGQEIVAPVDERSQRLLPWKGGTASAGQDTKLIVETIRELPWL